MEFEEPEFIWRKLLIDFPAVYAILHTIIWGAYTPENLHDEKGRHTFENDVMGVAFDNVTMEEAVTVSAASAGRSGQWSRSLLGDRPCPVPGYRGLT